MMISISQLLNICHKPLQNCILVKILIGQFVNVCFASIAKNPPLWSCLEWRNCKDVLPPSLEILDFGHEFSHFINEVLPQLQKLTFGIEYHQPFEINRFTPSLRLLYLEGRRCTREIVVRQLFPNDTGDDSYVLLQPM